MTLSLRTRLLFGMVVGLAGLLCILCAVIYTATRHVLVSHFDKSLLDSAKMLSAVVEIDDKDNEDKQQEGHQDKESGQKIDFEFDVRLMPEFNNRFGGGYYQFRDVDGRTINRSPSLMDEDLDVFAEITEAFQYKWYVLPDGKVGRAIGFQFMPRGDSKSDKIPFSVVIARDAGMIYSHLHFLKWLLVICSVAMVLLSVIAALFVTRTGLRPVRALADEISAIRADNLCESCISKKYPAELLPVVECLNGLMQRLKNSFDRERRFTSDVAHELRTPVAGMRTTVEVCLLRAREPQEYQVSLGTCLEIAKSMHRMIDALLSMARLESKQMSLNYENISLNSLITDCRQSFADGACDEGVIFENRMNQDIVCESDKDVLSMIISNILDNAVEYCDEGGRIWVGAKESEGFVTLSISNTGCKLKPQEAESVFDSFWRGDKSRHEAGSHCGIGLAVVQRLVQVLGGTVRAEIETGQIFTIHLRLPMKKDTASQIKDF